jgi:hypothetical protein
MSWPLVFSFAAGWLLGEGIGALVKYLWRRRKQQKRTPWVTLTGPVSEESLQRFIDAMALERSPRVGGEGESPR